MLKDLALSLLKNKWTYIISMFVLLGYFAYSQYIEKERLEHLNVVLVQNEKALKDSLFNQADSIQTLTIFVRDLNSDKKRLKKEYIALETKYQLLVNSIKDSGQVVGELKDSIATTKFSGKQFIVNYAGRTDYNLKTDSSKWKINITFDEIKAKSEIIFEDSSKLWRIKTHR